MPASPAPDAPPVTLPASPTPTPKPAPPVTVVALLLAHYGDHGQVCGQLWLRSVNPDDVGRLIVLRLTFTDFLTPGWMSTGATVSVDLVAGQLRYDACLTVPDGFAPAAHAGAFRLEIDPASTAALSGAQPTSAPLLWLPPAPSPAHTPASTPAATPPSGGHGGAGTSPGQP